MTSGFARGFHPLLGHHLPSTFLSLFGFVGEAAWGRVVLEPTPEHSAVCLDTRCVNGDFILLVIWQMQKVVIAFAN